MIKWGSTINFIVLIVLVFLIFVTAMKKVKMCRELSTAITAYTVLSSNHTNCLLSENVTCRYKIMPQKQFDHSIPC